MIINSDSLAFLKSMDDEIVHMAVTSPPYFGLRDYKVDGQIGLEKTPEEYVRKLVEIFHELKRVLRSDGTFWLNIGDSYASAPCGSFNGGSAILKGRDLSGHATSGNVDKSKLDGIKQKDMLGIPWLLAFALRADGWYLRADLPWIKRNSMPSSVQDRPASSIEHVFLFSKSRKYYYDYIATMQPSSESYNKDKRPRGQLTQRVGKDRKYPEGDANYSQFRKQDNTGNNTYTGFNDRYEDNGTGLRFMRDSDFFFRTWQGLLHNEDGEPMALVVNPRGYKGAHFACFPIQLVEPMILAGTSEKGVCSECGSPWVRLSEKNTTGCNRKPGFIVQPNPNDPRPFDNSARCGDSNITTIGWQPTCTCNSEPIPALVLDPFAGSSATGVACKWHNRNYLGIELNPEYCKLGNQRISEGK